MSRIRIWLQKKKTYFSAGMLAVIACLGYFSRVLDGANALALLAFAGGLAGLGAKSQRTADQILAALDNVRNAQARAAAQHTPIDLKQLTEQVAREIAPQVVSAITAMPIDAVPRAAAANAVPFVAELTAANMKVAGQMLTAKSEEPAFQEAHR